MHKMYIDFFCDPVDKGKLIFTELESSADNLLEGVFVNPVTGTAYPLMHGVAVFLPGAFPTEWLSKNSSCISELKNKFPDINMLSFNADKEWSFSSEWEAHSEREMQTTWGMTVDSRFDQFLLEVEADANEIAGKKILDAGCGNGMLTEHFALKGMQSFGIDYSNSVFSAEANRKNDNVCFLRGDLQQPPFADGFFDIVVSNGVIHHTSNTEHTFHQLASTVKQGGSYYIWLYERKGSAMWGAKRRIFDWLRRGVSRMPSGIQNAVVGIFTKSIYSAYKLAGSKLDYETLHVDMYDSLTPRWRHYHTPEEVSRWYHEAGFGAVRLTHWDNKYGFGVYALKSPVSKPPGESYKKFGRK
jgi:SAM-dependent methyltransferase/uncharacterized protein YbaR (Trm112 family)